FPAGNSGVGLWFVHQAADAEWTLRGAPVAVHASDSRGRPLNGMAVDATVAAPELEIREAVLSSLRVLRDYQALRNLPAQLAANANVEGRNLVRSRDRPDGPAGDRT